jgi:NAD(P)-dependent dehydrogenase (short-subunit alcohol dehydrogenase family)
VRAAAGQDGDRRPVAVVTGANRGIGREVARQLAGRGFLVVAGSRDPGAGERTARQLDPEGGSVIARRLDVTDPATIQAAADWTAQNLGRADVLVINAAILYDTWQQAWNADLAVVATRWTRTSSAPGGPRRPSCRRCAAAHTLASSK